jgi:hypothetical protein
MANFRVHLVGGAIVSGFVSSALAYTDLYSLEQAVVLWAAGTVGGLLPDIDSDSSAALSWIFSLLGFIASLFVLQAFSEQSLVVIWTMMVCMFLAVRLGLKHLFMRLTRHRGAYHSCLAGCFTGLSAAYISWRFLGHSDAFAWGLGGLVSIGFITHLLLDECYSVDITGARIKRSFGSALKPFSLKAWWASAVFGVGSVALWHALPSSDRLVSAITALILHPPNWQFAWVSCL